MKRGEKKEVEGHTGIGHERQRGGGVFVAAGEGTEKAEIRLVLYIEVMMVLNSSLMQGSKIGQFYHLHSDC